MTAGGSAIGNSPASHRHPNVVVVVLDCMRSIDFAGGSDPVPGLPASEKLRTESMIFPQAVAPSPWTIPSHASLFTGLYPWEHRTHYRASLLMDPSVPTLAGAFSDAGYSSIALSANGFVSPDFRLTNGFEAVGWGDWWERYFRVPTRTLPPRAERLAPTQRLPSGALWRSMTTRVSYTHRLPGAWDLLNRVAHQVRWRGDPRALAVSPWIEPTLDRWLTGKPVETPVFCFVNYMETHEPYLTDPAVVSRLAAWLPYAGQRIDRTSILTGDWKASAEDFRRIRELYRQSVRLADQRLGALIDVLKRTNRWDNTVLVIVGDHGQAIGEHGFLFHGIQPWESILRVPLWYRRPDGRFAGTIGQGTASLVDVAPTVLADAGLAPARVQSGVHLGSLAESRREGPAYSVSDGVHRTSIVGGQERSEGVIRLDRVWVTAFQGDLKIVWDCGLGRATAYDLRRDPGETLDVFDEGSPDMLRLASEARHRAELMQSSEAVTESVEVDERLRSWGYT
ncbi:MAG: sulfatase-like hydrolase/transferase [Thermoplasmata archaeon]